MPARLADNLGKSLKDMQRHQAAELKDSFKGEDMSRMVHAAVGAALHKELPRCLAPSVLQVCPRWQLPGLAHRHCWTWWHGLLCRYSGKRHGSCQTRLPAYTLPTRASHSCISACTPTAAGTRRSEISEETCGA